MLMADGCVLVVGGNRGLGKEIARHYATAGRHVVVTGRDDERLAETVSELGGDTASLSFDLSDPRAIAPALASVGPVGCLVLAGIDRDENSVKDYDIARAIQLVTLKLVGYTEVVHTLRDRLTPDASIVIFGGLAKERPYPGSTTVSTVNGGVVGMVRTMCYELAPIRVNSIHPGVVEDSPYWADRTEALDRLRARTLTGRMTRMADIVDATRFLLENPAVNGIELFVDGGWIIN
jgi:NAD(P)-dependent dehydrogenase (short-subunit alcohol dehydrogenase family)